MLMSEWIEAVKSELPAEYKTAAINCYALACRIYISNKGNDQFMGKNRHKQLAAWFNLTKNRELAQRYRRFCNFLTNRKLKEIHTKITYLNQQYSQIVSHLI